LCALVYADERRSVRAFADTQADSSENVRPRRLASNHLPNPILVHDRVISGGLPEGDNAFRELAKLGIRTVVSVDGMKPDVALAKKHGLRYVHLPHGYDGISERRIQELAVAVRDLEGPIYLHCHHGKHRSPVAASVACVSAGLIPSNEAIAVLRLAGTDTNYKGLYEVARRAKALNPRELDQADVEFKSVQRVPPIAEAMVQLDTAHEHLKRIEAAGWRVPSDHPDITPSHQVLLLRELFTELLRTKDVAHKSDEFQAWLKSSEATARELHTALNKWHDDGAVGTPPANFSTLARRISSDCKSCHAKYRDVPLRHP